MKKIKGRCKFCGADVTLSLFDPGRQWFTEKWLVDIAACNRCADFMESRRRIFESVRTLVHTFATTRETARKEKTKDSLTKIVQEWLRVMNNYFKTTITWDPSVMDLLLDEKTNVNTVLLQCERMLRQETPVAALRVGRAVFPIQ